MEIQIATRRRRAFTLVELLVVIALVALFAAMLLPAGSNRGKAQRIICVNNLKQLNVTFKMWANDNNGKYPQEVSTNIYGVMEFVEQGNVASIFQVLTNQTFPLWILYCPADTNRFYETNLANLDNRNISYFVGLDATEDNPQSILLGDDNLAVNGKPVQSGVLNLTSNNAVEWTNERHHRAGNIAFADGSAAQTTIAGLNKAISVTGIATNRLVIP